MEYKILGIHHVTAIARDVQPNIDFYTKVLGLRLVKKTVNFDDPGIYHFYYGNETGEPGTILTFFPWLHIVEGVPGTGQTSAVQFTIPKESVDFWVSRFKAKAVRYNTPAQRVEEEYISFTDTDGLRMELVASDKAISIKPYVTVDIPQEHAIRGLHGITLSLNKHEETAHILTEVFGYKLTGQHENRFRFATDAVSYASIVDILSLPNVPTGSVAGGSVHHVAFRVDSYQAQDYYRNKIDKLGYDITPVIDRDYFQSVYFWEPGGILFEIATDPPGFTVDEPLEELGKNLKLPKRYESIRKHLEETLPPIIL